MNARTRNGRGNEKTAEKKEIKLEAGDRILYYLPSTGRYVDAEMKNLNGILIPFARMYDGTYKRLNLSFGHWCIAKK